MSIRDESSVRFVLRCVMGVLCVLPFAVIIPIMPWAILDSLLKQRKGLPE